MKTEKDKLCQSGNRYEWPFHPLTMGHDEEEEEHRARKMSIPHRLAITVWVLLKHHFLFKISNHIGTIQVYDEMSNSISHPIGLAIRSDPPVLWQFLKENKKKKNP